MRSQTYSFTGDSLDEIEEQMLAYFVSAGATMPALRHIAQRGGYGPQFDALYSAPQEGPQTAPTSAPPQTLAQAAQGMSEQEKASALDAAIRAATGPKAAAPTQTVSSRAPSIDALLASDTRQAKESTTLGSGEAVGIGTEVVTPEGETGIIRKVYRGGAIVEFEDGTGREFKSGELKLALQQDAPAAEPTPVQPAEPASDAPIAPARATELGQIAMRLVGPEGKTTPDTIWKLLSQFGVQRFDQLTATQGEQIAAELDAIQNPPAQPTSPW